MKVRNLENLPVMLQATAEEIGWVERAVIGDDYTVAYLVIIDDKKTPGIIRPKDFSLGEKAVMISDRDCIKSYQHGEESSIYEKKCGDTLFDASGRELGLLSDFIINRDDKKVSGVEVTAGVLKDILEGRRELPLTKVSFVSRDNVILNQEGNDDL